MTDFDPDSVTQQQLREYRRAAEQAWGDDTRHPNFVGHPQPSAGQCYVTSRWLTTKIPGLVGSKDGHYLWVSPDKRYGIDLTGDQHAYPPHHPAVEGMQMDEEDEPWEYDPELKLHRPGPVMFKPLTHPIFKGTRVRDFKGEPARLAIFTERANQALANPQARTADFGWGGDANPGQEPQVLNRMEHDRPDHGPEHYKWVFANGRLELDPEQDYNNLADFVGAGSDHSGPVAMGEVRVVNGKADWSATGNVGLGTLASVLQDHCRKTGWQWGGIHDLKVGSKLAHTMFWSTDDDGRLLLSENPRDPFDWSEIRIVGKTAHIYGSKVPEGAFEEWAEDFGYHLALTTDIKTPEDIDGYDTYGPRPDFMQGPTNTAPPGGTLRCPECGQIFPSFGLYLIHRKSEEPQGDELDREDGHFPEMDQDKVLPPHFHDREPRIFPLAKTAHKLDRHTDQLWYSEDHIQLGAYVDGELVGQATIVPEDRSLVVTAVRYPEMVYTRLVQNAQARFDSLDYWGPTPVQEMRLARLNFVEVSPTLWKWAAGKEPMDMIENPVPFIFDVDKDQIIVGKPGQNPNGLIHPDSLNNPDWEPKGIVQGTYEPGGKVTVTNQVDFPWTVRHLVDLWYWSYPHMRVTDVQYEDPMGNKTKLTKTAQNVGQYVKQLAATDPAVWKAYQALEAAGGEVYAVGGVVRDALMNEASNDIDLMVTGLHSDQVNDILSKLPGKMDLTGKSFGVYRYHYKGHEVEIALPRTERSTGDRRVDFDVNVDHTLPVEDDLLRRDFTGNSIAVSLKDGRLVDPFGGADDIKNGVLRTTHPNSFAEDPTRTLRALVMNGRYGWNPDERTRAEMEQHGHRIHNESWDNMNGIMDKLMKSKDPARAIRLAQETGLLKHVFPELASSWDFDQKNPHHNYPLGTHHMHVLEGVSEATDDPDMRYAALAHDWGKPRSQWFECKDCGVYLANDRADGKPTDDGRCPRCNGELVGHYYQAAPQYNYLADDGTLKNFGQNHDVVGQAMWEERARHMKLSTSRIKRVGELIRHHMFPAFSSGKGARKFLNRVGDHADDLMILRHADMYGKGTDEYQNEKTQVQQMQELVEQARAGGAPTQLSGLAINGRDLMQAGVPQGPMIGQILNQLMQQVVENPELNSREALLGLVQGQMNANSGQQAV